MVTNILKRPRGRPKGFIPDEALDRAVEMFWEHGYEGVDVDRIARAVNVTKPALYRAFGDKSTLLLRAVERYGLTYGAPRMAAFQAEPDIHKAVTAFCEATVNSLIPMLPKHLNGTVECFVGDKAFRTSSGALRDISYHSVRNSLHCRCDYRTLAYVRLQGK